MGNLTTSGTTQRQGSAGVAVAMTVRNDPDGTRVTLDSLREQSLAPSEVVVVDGGSTDGTREMLAAYAEAWPALSVIDAPGDNIAQGRNRAIRSATCDIVACTDAGCRADERWLERITAPLRNSGADFVAGFYEIEPANLLERVIGLATMRGQLEPVDPERFNPSARSVAFTREIWRRAGGYPEWLRYSEDTLFDHKVRALRPRWHFEERAIVRWRPRTGLRQLWKQFYAYGTGRGRTGIDAASFHHNIRDGVLVIAAMLLAFVTPWSLLVAAVLAAHFYVGSTIDLARKIGRKARDRRAALLTFPVMWVVRAAQTAGFVSGRLARARSGGVMHQRQADYMRIGNESSSGNRAVSGGCAGDESSVPLTRGTRAAGLPAS